MVYYNEVLVQDPNSPYAAEAQKRIAVLKERTQQSPKTAEQPKKPDEQPKQPEKPKKPSKEEQIKWPEVD